MIHRPLHPEPDSEHPTTERKNPECFLGYPPPPIDRFELIDPHEEVGKEIDDHCEPSEAIQNPGSLRFIVTHFITLAMMRTALSDSPK